MTVQSRRLDTHNTMLASRFASRLSRSAVPSRIIVRTLVTPTQPVPASVSDKHYPSSSNSAVGEVQEDPGPSDAGERFAKSLPSTSAGHEGAVEGEGKEMFGFKLNPVATKTGGNAKSEGRPIYLDMQVRTGHGGL